MYRNPKILSIFFIFSIIILLSYNVIGQKKGVGQKKTDLYIQTLDSTRFSFKKSNKKYYYTDSIQINQLLDEIIEYFKNNAYLESSVDSLVSDTNKTLNAWIHFGKKYYFGNVSFDSVFIQHNKYNPIYKSFQKGKILSERKFASETDNVIRLLENNGYPFAKLTSKLIELNNYKADIYLNLELGPKIFFDSIEIEGNLKISKWFLYNSTGIYPNKPYNELRIKQISDALSSYSFIEKLNDIKIKFSENKAILLIKLNTEKTNTFSGIAGITNQDPITGKTNITGELKILLNNTFKIGETMQFEWQKPIANSQNLLCFVSFPFILNAPIGADARLNLEKRDTSYLNSLYEFGIISKIAPFNSLGVFYRGKQSTTLSNKTHAKSNSDVDFDMWLYGLKYSYAKIDYPFNPRKGVKIATDVAIGSKSIKEYQNFPDSVLKKINVKPNVYEWNLIIDYFIPVYRKFCIMSGLKLNHMSHYLFDLNHKNNIFFENEFYRIGGLKTIRGFDDLSIKASSLAVASIELRFLPDRSSNIFIFADHALVEKKGLNSTMKNRLTGIGTGLNIETKAGAFSIVYALGKFKDSDFVIKSAKIHFGYTTRF